MRATIFALASAGQGAAYQVRSLNRRREQQITHNPLLALLTCAVALPRLPVWLTLLRKGPWPLDRVLGVLHSQHFTVVHVEGNVERIAEAH